MFAVRIHGRGGQGAVTAAELLAAAAFDEGRHAQAFPTFGSERTGAPVVSFCRIDDRPIRLHEPITDPDALIVQDPTLLHQVNLFAGLKSRGFLVINTSRSPHELGLEEVVDRLSRGHAVAVPATDIARAELGRPLPNAALLGGFAALTRQVTLPAITKAIRLIGRGSRFIVTNPDATGPSAEGPLPATGAIAALITKATGKEPYVVGKPNPMMFRSALNKIGAHSEHTAMIGDRMDTDIVAGIEAGLHTVLVLTGISDQAEIEKYPFRPDEILSGVHELVPAEPVETEF